jgi:type I restriction enzyme S subunit
VTADVESLSELPNGWAWTTLENCVDILDSQRVPVNAKEREAKIAGKSSSELYPYYGATGQVGWIDDYLFEEELLLLGEDGAPFLEPMKEKAYVVNGKCWVNNHAHVLRATREITSNSFLRHYLNLFDYRGFVTGTTRFKLNQSPMRRIPIPLAPLNEQRRIVSKVEELFSCLNAGVESLLKVKTLLKRYRQAVLKYAFEGKLTEEWRKTHKDQAEPAQKLLQHMKQEQKKNAKGKYKELPPIDTSSLPELPESWTWIRVADISETIQYGTSEKAGTDASGVPVLRMGNIKDGKILFDDLKYFPQDWPQLKEFLLEEGDVLFNRTNSAELVGKTAVYEKHHPKAVFASYLIRIKTNKNTYNSSLLSHYINSLHGRRYIGTVVSQQVGQANVNGTKLSLMPVPLLPFEEQQEINREIERNLSIIDTTDKNADQTLNKSERMRQSILKMAFEGRLVPQDPADEPAEKLLERIKGNKIRQDIKNKGSTRDVGLMHYVK